MLFENNSSQKPKNTINIYADEIYNRIDPDTNEKWMYIGIILEDLHSTLLEDIKTHRHKNNFDIESPYYTKNNKIVHWNELNSADTYNIADRWFSYILDSNLSCNNFSANILGINTSKLDPRKFGGNEQKDPLLNFYQRFFRTALSQPLKSRYKDGVIIENLYHDQGSQQYHEYFPWYTIKNINTKYENITFKNKNIKFINKDHKRDDKANLLQVCDCFLGAVTSIIHGDEETNGSRYRMKLMDKIFPLVNRMVKQPKNPNSRYQHMNRITITFFPKSNDFINKGDIEIPGEFFSNRHINYYPYRSNQLRLFS